MTKWYGLGKGVWEEYGMEQVGYERERKLR